jgi:chemotaxis protein MotA
MTAASRATSRPNPRSHEDAPARPRLDLRSLAVLPAGVAVVLLAQLLEGGVVRSLVQGPAALIVFGGTCAAVLITFSPADVWRAAKAAARTFVRPEDDDAAMAARLVAYAVRIRRDGVLALEADVERITDPYLRTGLSLVVDGVSLPQLKDVLDAMRAATEADEDRPARVFEAAGGYAPTLGILGAVLGLIQVMEHLTQPGAIGSGIAVAFVATIYGVGGANLLFLPIAGRLREEATAADRRRELITEGIVALHQRLNPRMVARHLSSLTGEASLHDAAARSPGTRGAQVRT